MSCAELKRVPPKNCSEESKEAEGGLPTRAFRLSNGNLQ